MRSYYGSWTTQSRGRWASSDRKDVKVRQLFRYKDSAEARLT